MALQLAPFVANVRHAVVQLSQDPLQRLALDRRSACEGDGALQHLLELLDVAREVAACEELGRFRRQADVVAA